MKHIDHIEAPVHGRTCSVHAGTLTYEDPTGEAVSAEFYVRTCEDESTASGIDAQGRGDRQDDLNEQYADEVSELMAEGCDNIHFNSVQPNPFF